jgi:hypothetical protein
MPLGSSDIKQIRPAGKLKAANNNGDRPSPEEVSTLYD